MGRYLWDEVTARLQGTSVPAEIAAEEAPRIYGDPVLVRPRLGLGQGTFPCPGDGQLPPPLRRHGREGPTGPGRRAHPSRSRGGPAPPRQRPPPPHRCPPSLRRRLRHRHPRRPLPRQPPPQGRLRQRRALHALPQPAHLDARRPCQPAQPGGAGVALGGGVFGMREPRILAEVLDLQSTPRIAVLLRRSVDCTCYSGTRSSRIVPARSRAICPAASRTFASASGGTAPGTPRRAGPRPAARRTDPDAQPREAAGARPPAPPARIQSGLCERPTKLRDPRGGTRGMVKETCLQKSSAASACPRSAGEIPKPNWRFGRLPLLSD